MKILSIVDKRGSAIDRCCWGVRDNIDFFQYEIVDYHPKRPSNEQIDLFVQKAREADLLDFQYWKTAETIRNNHPEIFNSKKKILTHHNPYNLNDIDNTLFDRVVVKNRHQLQSIQDNQPVVKSPILIPHTIDMSLFQYKRQFDFKESNNKNFTVLMVAARIESSKGILSVVKAVKELDIQMILVGRISKKEYFSEILNAGAGNIEPRLNITEDVLAKSYQEADLLIVNSDENFESGPLPILEAMSSGTPVLTRNIGLVPDIYNDNMFLRTGYPEDVDSIKKDIQYVRNNQKMSDKYRENAFNSVVSRDNRYTARRYYRLYADTLHKEPMISIIIPTHNRIDCLMSSLIGAVSQTYRNIEVIVVDDGSEKGVQQAQEAAISRIRAVSNVNIKYITLESQGYGLARARNIGAQESDGDYLLFVDDRLQIEKRAVQSFFDHYCQLDDDKKYLFGDKGTQKANFVENFSFISKYNFVRAGMFTERITQYGGLTAETQKRFAKQGFKFIYCDNAKSQAIKSSKSKFEKKSQIINSKFQLWQLWEKRI